MNKLIILEKLLLNHKDNVDLEDYILQKDIVNMSDYCKSSISQKFKKLENEGYIKVHSGKTKLYNSMSDGRAKIYVPTLKGIENGGLTSKFKKITGGPKDSSIFNRFGIGLADMHGKLHIKIPINHEPEDDGLVWKEPDTGLKGTQQYIRFIEKAGDRVTIEKFVGKEHKSIILKPRFIADFQDSPEDLINRFIDVAWAIWSDLEMKGYELAFPEGPEGEAKFTLRCPLFEEIGYTDSKNILIDYSQDVAELHPTTGSLKANKLMSELLLDSHTINNKFENNVVSEEEFIKGMDEIGEYTKMVDIIEKIYDKHERTEKKVDLIANSFNKLLEMINENSDQQKEYEPPEFKGGNIYG